MSSMSDLKYKPGDPLNPYDPASLDLGEEGVSERARAGTGPVNANMAQMLTPEGIEMLKQIMQADADELRRTGENLMDKIRREKLEWAAADARSAKLKEQGNAAFREGDYKEAYVIYTVCRNESAQEPVYHLNLAAAALKLKLYEDAVDAATGAIKRESDQPKGYFRRGQAYRFLSRWDDAQSDYAKALEIQPNDTSVQKELKELKELLLKSDEKKITWLAEQGAQTEDDVFGEGELKQLVKERLDMAKASL